MMTFIVHVQSSEMTSNVIFFPSLTLTKLLPLSYPKHCWPYLTLTKLLALAYPDKITSVVFP